MYMLYCGFIKQLYLSMKFATVSVQFIEKKVKYMQMANSALFTSKSALGTLMCNKAKLLM